LRTADSPPLTSCVRCPASVSSGSPIWHPRSRSSSVSVRHRTHGSSGRGSSGEDGSGHDVRLVPAAAAIWSATLAGLRTSWLIVAAVIAVMIVVSVVALRVEVLVARRALLLVIFAVLAGA